MSVNIRLPHISGTTDREQLSQIKSYLHQLVEQLNWALSSLGTGEGTAQGGGSVEVQGSDISYYELRSLIIQQTQDAQRLINELSERLANSYLPKEGWEANMHLTTDADGNVVGSSGFDKTDIDYAAAQVLSRISFTMDEDYNLYYEVLEE